MKKIAAAFLFVCLFIVNGTTPLFSQQLEAFKITPDWLAKIEENTPSKTIAKSPKKRKILLFSLFTGFNHWVVPHSDAVIKSIATKTGAFEITYTKDVGIFDTKKLKKFDAIVLNNNCSIGPRRDLFYDALEYIADTLKRERKAATLENNLLNYVKNGGGLVILHGAIVMQNNSSEMSNMVGGSFDYHPEQQPINVKIIDSSHPMVQPFGSTGFQHIDEPYFFKNAYFDFNFRPLLYIETKELKLKKPEKDNIKYISWIKRYGKGRVFYSSPSHNAQSYDNPNLIAFIMNGLQYTTGDLTCDDSPIGINPNN